MVSPTLSDATKIREHQRESKLEQPLKKIRMTEDVHMSEPIIPAKPLVKRSKSIYWKLIYIPTLSFDNLTVTHRITQKEESTP
jgi:hypothetical protein